MRKLLRATGIFAATAALALSGLLAGTASAQTRSGFFNGTGVSSIESFAIQSATSQAYFNASTLGFPSSSCHQQGIPLVHQSGTIWTATVTIYCLYNFPDPPPPPTGPTGRVLGVHSGKCLDVAAANPADGTAVQIYDCNGTNAQSWLIGSDNTLRALGKCLSTVGNGTTDHTLVEIRTCTGSVGQKWEHVGTTTSFRNPNSGRCLDVLGFQTANGSRPGLWECNGLSNQQWVIPA